MKTKYLTVIASLIALGTGAASAKGKRNFREGGSLPDFLQQHDVNDDGVIDEEERQAAKAARQAARDDRRAEIDTNEDGTVSDDERAAAHEARASAIEARRAERFAMIAGDDNVISAVEFATIPALEGRDVERIASMFDRLDANDNSEVSLDEFNARLRDHRGEAHGRKERREGRRGRGERPNVPAPPEPDPETSPAN